MTTSVRISRSDWSAIKWLIILALAWSQLASAAHQFEHEADERDEDCMTCVQHDRDATTADAVQLQDAIPAAFPNHRQEHVSVAAQPVARYNARASP